MRGWSVFGLMLVGGLLTAAPGGAGGGRGNVELGPLLKQLADSEFAMREAAQKQLDALPPSLRDRLIALETKESDPEIKARLAKRIDQMEVEQVIYPSPITLKMQNQPLNKVVESLNEQMGSAQLTTTLVDAFSIDAREQPFWEAFRQLDKQHPLEIYAISPATAAARGGNGALMLLDRALANGGIPADFRVSKGFAVVPAVTLRRVQMVEVVDLPHGLPVPYIKILQEQLYVNIRVMGDPRVRVLNFQSAMTYTDFVDDQDRNLVPRMPVATGLATQAWPTPQFTAASTIDVTGMNIKRIKVLKGTLRAVVPLKMESIVIENPTVPVKNAVKTTIGEYTIEATDAPPAATADRYLIKFEKVPVTPAVAATQSRMFLRTYNKDGQAVLSTSAMARETFAYSISVPRALPPAGARDPRPVRMEVMYPVKTAEVVIEVEFRDVPVTQQNP